MNFPPTPPYSEPSVETMLELFAQYDLNVINELVFCGFGEPLERLEDVCTITRESQAGVRENGRRKNREPSITGIFTIWHRPKLRSASAK